MEEEWQGDVEYKRLSVQEKTSIEASGSICWSIYHWQGSFYQCNQTTIVNFNEDLSSCEH